MDAPADGAIDAPPGPATRVWVEGDYVSDGATVAGSFSDGVALPVVPPSLASSLGARCWFYGGCFDATSTKIAFAANPSDPSQAELYIADVDGQNATRLVATQPGVDVLGVALSPDATKIAFSKDSTAQDGSYDVWIVDTTGSGTPVRVSPDYVMQDVPQVRAPTLRWSADSRYVGFTGGFNTPAVGAYVTDTAPPVPSTVALFSDADLQSGYNVLTPVLFDASDRVYVRSSATSPAWALFIADPDGQNRHTLAMPHRSDGTPGRNGLTNISGDGTTIVFASDAPTQDTFELYTSSTAAWNPVQVTTASAAGTEYFVGPGLPFSPDASAIVAEVRTPTSFGIDRISLDGTVRAHLLEIGSAGSTYTIAGWTLDGQGIYLTADVTGSGHAALYRLDTHSVNQSPVLAVAPPTNGDVYNALIRPM